MLLQCWLDLRDNEYSKVLKDLERIPAQSDALLESQRLLLTGIALNNKSEPAKASTLIERSIGIMTNLEVTDLRFLAQTNLFFCHLNCKNRKGMEQVLKIQDHFSPLSPSQKITLALQHINLEKFKGDLEKAGDWVLQIKTLRSEMSESQKLQYSLSCFDLEVKKGDLEACEVILQELKGLRKFNVTANYKFMRIMLDHLIHDKTIYAYHRNFGKFPNLEAQIQVVQCLESGNRDEALKWWNKLRDQNPEAYRGKFDYRGDVCLFSLVLRKHLDIGKENDSLVSNPLPERKDLALIAILKKTSGPISKESIFQALWGIPPADKAELNRLERVVSRVRKEHGIEVVSKKGAYSLKKK